MLLVNPQRGLYPTVTKAVGRSWLETAGLVNGGQYTPGGNRDPGRTGGMSNKTSQSGAGAINFSVGFYVFRQSFRN